MKNYVFPLGVVVLDIDAPTKHFWWGNPGHDTMVEGIRALCQDLSSKWGLGRYWLYRTLSGMHVVFEKNVGLGMVIDVLLDANNRVGWHQCGGHVARFAGQEIELRVGVKGDRPFDIASVPGNPDLLDAREHVVEHAIQLAVTRM